MDVPCEQATCKDVLGIKIEEKTYGEEIICSVVDDSCTPIISKITSAGIKIESVCSYAGDNIKVEQCDIMYVPERPGLATQEMAIEDTTTSEQVAVKCEHTECSSETEDQTDGIVTFILDDSGAPVSSKIANVGIKIESVWSYDEDDIKEESDVHVPERIGLAKQERDVKDEVYECEQVAVKCEQTESSSDVTDKDELLDNCEIIEYCDQIDDRSNVISRHCEVRYNHLKRTLNNVNSSSPKNAQVYICDTCDRSCKTKAGLIKHIRVHLDDMPSKGDISTKHLSSIQHNRIHTGDKYKCNVCMKCFKRKHALIEHQRTHTGEKPFKCYVCMKCFTKKGNLNMHSRIHTGEKPFKCDVCMKCFTNKSYLTIHSRLHTGEKPFKCDVCMKCFSQKSSLITHNKIHIGNKPFKCVVCMKCFYSKTILIEHSRTHTDEKPVKCDVCNKSFRKKASLSEHSRLHTGEKPFKCDVCMKCFPRRSYLTVHKRIHTGEKPYKCDVCMKCFSKKSDLNRHNKRHMNQKM